ncbi:glucosamine-6-phosphate deaminase, partial [bacterium]|nr:glucosamine-6-phosphate deaminase [bacterium]
MNAEILRFTTPDDLYRSLLGRLVRELESLQATSHGPVLALPTGNTMIPFYELMVKNQNLLLPESWTCFQLDEYYPIPASKEPLGFRNYLDRHLFSKLLTPPRCREHPDGGAEDADLECARYEARIREVGGIDLAILGIGTNGHIAFNEPGSPHHSRTRRVELHPDTLQANFGSDAPFHHAITLGIETLLEARKI